MTKLAAVLCVVSVLWVIAPALAGDNADDDSGHHYRGIGMDTSATVDRSVPSFRQSLMGPIGWYGRSAVGKNWRRCGKEMRG